MALAHSKRSGGLRVTERRDAKSTLPSTGLLLIGIGPGRLSGVTVEARDAAKAADVRRYEAYTALWPEDELRVLENAIGPIEKVMRPEVELPDTLFELARSSLVALLIVGDPLQATTHVDLQLQANEAGIECRVYHGVSITTLIGAIGLSNYKFGRQTTLTYPYGGWVATSPLEAIAVNLHQNLHSLALLDLDPTGEGVGNQKPMKPIDALNSLELMREKLSQTLEGVSRETALENMRFEACTEFLSHSFEDVRVVVCADMGTESQQITSTTIGGLKSCQGGRLNTLVFPASPSEVEEKALLRWYQG